MKATHRVAKRMIERLEAREGIQVDHGKFARLTLDKSLSQRQTWIVPGGIRIQVEERYSLTFCQAMNTPSEGLSFRLTVKCFDGDEIRESKALARSGRDVARRLSHDGLKVKHQSEIGMTPHHTVNVFEFFLLAHHSNYRNLILPHIRFLLKPFIESSTTRDIVLSVGHPCLESYARQLAESLPKHEPQHPSPYI